MLSEELGELAKFQESCVRIVGEIALGEQAKALGIEKVCFDRSGRRYHGRVKALADAAREAGLKF